MTSSCRMSSTSTNMIAMSCLSAWRAEDLVRVDGATVSATSSEFVRALQKREEFPQVRRITGRKCGKAERRLGGVCVVL